MQTGKCGWRGGDFFQKNKLKMAQDNPVLDPVPENDEDGTSQRNLSATIPILPPQPNNADNTELLGPYARLYFVLAGQWFLPLENIINARNPLQRRCCRIAYAVWQFLVVLIMWLFFFYSMGVFKIRTLQEVDWLCPLTNIKNMVYGLSWIVYQHLGLVFFLFSDLEKNLDQLTIKKEEVRFLWRVGWVQNGMSGGRGVGGKLRMFGCAEEAI